MEVKKWLCEAVFNYLIPATAAHPAIHAQASMKFGKTSVSARNVAASTKAPVRLVRIAFQLFAKGLATIDISVNDPMMTMAASPQSRAPKLLF